MESILTCIKQLLGITSDYTKFDSEIITHINSIMMTLAQLGVGPAVPFQITGTQQTWNDFLGNKVDVFSGIKSYIYFKVKLMWDPPSSAAVLESMNRTINEFEWRLNVNAETPDVGAEETDADEADLLRYEMLDEEDAINSGQS